MPVQIFDTGKGGDAVSYLVEGGGGGHDVAGEDALFQQRVDKGGLAPLELAHDGDVKGVLAQALDDLIQGCHAALQLQLAAEVAEAGQISGQLHDQLFIIGKTVEFHFVHRAFLLRYSPQHFGQGSALLSTAPML